MRILLTTLSLLFLFVQAADAGVIKGKINAGKRLRRSPAVIYLADTVQTFQPPAENPTMDQRNMTFIPHILPIQAGTTIDFLNNDEVRHNVFSPDHEKYNLGTWPTGSVKQHTFSQKGVYNQLCNVHPEMAAFIIVLDTPYFTLTAKDGSFTLPNIPAGNYTIKVWHEKLRFKKQPVLVADQSETEITFTHSGKR